MSIEAASNIIPRRCAISTCDNWTIARSGLCTRCHEKGLRAQQVVAALPPFDSQLVERTSAHRNAVTRVARKRRNEEEHDMQVALVEWCRTGEGAELAPCLTRIIGIPNGGSSTKMMNIKMWSEGRAKGFPDLFLPVALANYHGAMLELKRAGEVPTAEQSSWLRVLHGEGYAILWSDNLEAAQQWLLDYGRLAKGSA